MLIIIILHKGKCFGIHSETPLSPDLQGFFPLFFLGRTYWQTWDNMVMEYKMVIISDFDMLVTKPGK